MGKKVTIKTRPDFFKNAGAENLKVKEITFDERVKKLKIACTLGGACYICETDKVCDDLHKKFGDSLSIEFEIEYENSEITRNDLLQITEKVINELKKKNAVSRSFLYLYRIKVEDRKIFIELKNELAIETLYESRINLKLETLLNEYGIRGFEIHFIPGDFSKELEAVESKLDEVMIDLSRKMDEEQQKNAENSSHQNNSNNSQQGKTYTAVSSRKTKDIKGTPVPLKEFGEIYENDVCVLQGEVFNIDVKELKTGNTLYTIRITDNINSVTTKMFAKGQEKIDVKVGDFIKVNGRKQIDKFDDNEEILMLSSINKLDWEKPIKHDSAPEKMAELHTHSKMSEMVGVTEIKDLIKRAKSYGHTSMAITDYSVVHTFPFAYKETKKMKILKLSLGAKCIWLMMKNQW